MFQALQLVRCLKELSSTGVLCTIHQPPTQVSNQCRCNEIESYYKSKLESEYSINLDRSRGTKSTLHHTFCGEETWISNINENSSSLWHQVDKGRKGLYFKYVKCRLYGKELLGSFPGEYHLKLAGVFTVHKINVPGGRKSQVGGNTGAHFTTVPGTGLSLSPDQQPRRLCHQSIECRILHRGNFRPLLKHNRVAIMCMWCSHHVLMSNKRIKHVPSKWQIAPCLTVMWTPSIRYYFYCDEIKDHREPSNLEIEFTSRSHQIIDHVIITRFYGRCYMDFIKNGHASPRRQRVANLILSNLGFTIREPVSEWEMEIPIESSPSKMMSELKSALSTSLSVTSNTMHCLRICHASESSLSSSHIALHRVYVASSKVNQ
jgi:hypothetical protein